MLPTQVLGSEHSASLEPPCLSGLAQAGNLKQATWRVVLHQSLFQTFWTAGHMFQHSGSDFGTLTVVLQAGNPLFHLVSFSAEWRFCIERNGGEKKIHTHTQTHTPKVVYSQANPPVCSWSNFLFHPAETMFPDQSDLDYGETATVCHIISQQYVKNSSQSSEFLNEVLNHFFPLKITTPCAPPGSSSLLSCLSLEL